MALQEAAVAYLIGLFEVKKNLKFFIFFIF